ncbi:glycosyltransferase family 39 protein [Polyangium sorediatum]|uniref:Glycosyltransferase family 39 protein n=1 Tax=Polyangium sorediatum TaxID=889274 RepID=A0ABT6NT70_9BACT|nr:glycosyltransferase family 39 protein [Polyangium sorediatum]MDI1431508.1 glycosyltransferase family 39 protein [Polyangium sorediatum]
MSEIKQDPTDAADEKADRPEDQPATETETEAGPEAEAGPDAEAEAGPDAEAEADDDAADDDAADDDDPDADDPGDDPESPPAPDPLLRPGNPLQLVRGASTLATGALVALLLMALRPQYRVGVPIGIVAILVATFGLLDLCGTFDDPDERVAKRVALADLAQPLALLGGSVLGLLASVSLAVSGYLGPIGAGLAVPACFLGAVVSTYRVGEKLGAWEKKPSGKPIPLLRRHGFWLVTLVTLLYLPALGSHSLSDPWETHYGEVAREILARNDWISLWWAQDGWFWSKPVLDFWMQAIAMATFGVRYQPGAMLSAVAEGRVPWPEWAVRLPFFLITLVATYLLYKAVARVFGRRAGFFGGLVLTTMPQWFLVSHQTVTDMPFVATMSAAMALFLLGIHEDAEREVRVYEVSVGEAKYRFSGYHLVLGMIIACALPQILYLISRNLEILPSPFSLRFHADAFRSGSPMNCGIPGNQPCGDASPVLKGLQPALQAVLWIQALGLLLYMCWGERRAQRLYFLAAWFFAALSTMAKGPAGFGLPVLCALAYIVVSRRYRDLLRLEIVAGLLILLTVALPWFVAMYARHGQPFTDRLLFHDMFKRAFTHVHDTNEGDDVGFRFYVWQLGYAMFPWTGLVPAALVAWLRRREEGDRRSDASIFLAMWFLFAFVLFTLMLTKFHHYIMPALPPAAMLTGILLDEMVQRSGARKITDAFAEQYERVLWGAAAIAGGLLVFFVGRDLAGAREGMLGPVRLLHLFTYNYKRVFPSTLDFRTALLVFTSAAALFTLALVWARARRHVVTGLCAVSVLFTAWGIDVYFVKTSPHWGQRETVLAYYRAKQEIPGPIIAFQMNWKGENFYNGNAVPAFVSSGKKFQDYVLEQKKKGVKTFYFMTEHGRMGSLANELGAPRIFDKLTTPELNNKFGLVRATFE